MADALQEEVRDLREFWRKSGLTKRILGASLAASVAWEFAGALGFPAFQAWSAHSQTGMAVVTWLAAIWLSTRPPETDRSGSSGE